MAKKEVYSEDNLKLRFNGIYIPNFYLYDKNLCGNMKLLLSMLVDIEENYGNRIIKVVYFSKDIIIKWCNSFKRIKQTGSIRIYKIKNSYL